MSNCKKAILVCGAIMLWCYPAFANVVNLYDLRNSKFMGSTNLGKSMTGAESCNPSNGTYSSKPQGMICSVVTLKGGTVCYGNCRCDEKLFPFAESDCTGGLEPTEESKVCNNNGEKRYASCTCAGGLIDSAEALKYSAYFNINAGNKGQVGNVACYDASSFTCKNASRKLLTSEVVVEKKNSLTYYTTTATSKVEPFIYNVAVNPANDDFVCVIGVSSLENGIFTSEPTNTECGKYAVKTSKYTSKQYYYYTGCSTEGNCGKPSSVCVSTDTEIIKTYDPLTNSFANVTCTFATGCKKGWEGTVYCDNDAVAKTGYSVNDEGFGCKSVACAEPYKQQSGNSSELVCKLQDCPENATYSTTEGKCVCDEGYEDDGEDGCKEEKSGDNGGSGSGTGTETCPEHSAKDASGNCVCDTGYEMNKDGKCMLMVKADDFDIDANGFVRPRMEDCSCPTHCCTSAELKNSKPTTDCCNCDAKGKVVGCDVGYIDTEYGTVYKDLSGAATMDNGKPSSNTALNNDPNELSHNIMIDEGFALSKDGENIGTTGNTGGNSQESKYRNDVNTSNNSGVSDTLPGVEDQLNQLNDILTETIDNNYVGGATSDQLKDVLKGALDNNNVGGVRIPSSMF